MQLHHRSNWFIALILGLCWFLLVCKPAQALVVDEVALVPRYAVSALRFTQRPTAEPLRTLWEKTLIPQLTAWGWQWSDMAPWVEGGGLQVQLPCATADCDAPRLLWIWRLKRPEAAAAFLSQYWQSHPFSSQTYQGIPLQVGEGLATATVGDHLLVASDPEAIVASLGSTVAQDANLGGLPFYQQALAEFDDQDTVIFYANLHPLTPQHQFVTAYDRLLVGVRSQNHEIHLEAAFHATASPQISSVPLSLNELALPPIDSRPTLVLAGGQLPSVYRALVANLETFTVATTPQGTAIVPQLLRDFTTKVGIDLEGLIFPLGSDRYTLALWRQPQGWQWWWQTRQTPETAALVAQLEAQAQAAGYDINRLVLDRQAVTAWVKLAFAPNTSDGLASEVAAVYRQNKDTFTLASALAYLLPLEERTPWLTAQLSRQRRGIVGFIWAQWPELYPYLAQQVPLVAYLNGLTAGWLQRLQSITWVNYGAAERLHRSEIILTTQSTKYQSPK